MIRSPILWVVLSAIATACESGPIAPTAIPGPLPRAAATLQPGVWDRAEELTAWTANGVSSGPAVVVGEDASAVIRIDMSAGRAVLHSPAFDPPVTDLKTIRIRARVVDASRTGSSPSLELQLQTPTFVTDRTLPWFFVLIRPGDGAWSELDFVPNNSYRAPFSANAAAITIQRDNRGGVLEIDWIALVRQ